MACEPRTIIHFNVADFAVAVERVLAPGLRGRPVIVAPEGAARACVFDMSDEAFLAGVRKGMRLDHARRIERDAEVLPLRRDRYERAMLALIERARPYTPLIEAADENGHLFLDMTGTGRLWGPVPDVAERIRRSFRWDLGFHPIWSVASNKLVAKVASRLVKPYGERHIAFGDEEAALKPVPIQLVPGIERDDLFRLREFHLWRAGEVAALSPRQLEVAVGSPARAAQLHATVRGVDTAPVLAVDRKPPVVTGDHVFPSDTNDAPAVLGAACALAERAGRELRARGLAARRVGVLLDYSDGARVSRNATTTEATAGDIRLFELTRAALERAWTRRMRVRHLRLLCDRLVYPPAQLDLFPEAAGASRHEADLCAALDAIRAKFGACAVRMGRTLAAG